MLKNNIIEIAKKYDADFVGFASADSFSPDDNIFKIFPDTKTVITLGFRVLRGIYRGVEEGTTFYQYTTMGVENLEETVMPLAMLGVCNVLEDADYYAFPQKNNLIYPFLQFYDIDKNIPNIYHIYWQYFLSLSYW